MHPPLCPVLIGRDDLLALADRRMGAARTGAGHLLFLPGEAGIGKTRLLAEVCDRASGQDFMIFGANAYPRDAEVAGGVLADLAPALQRPPGMADAGMRCRVSDPAAVPVAAGRSAYRIVQEGLTNARKHADGAEVSVTVRGSRGDGLTVEICNQWPPDAASTTAIPGAGSGIIGLAERASLAGGRLEHGRTPAGDFRLWAWLPWPA